MLLRKDRGAMVELISLLSYQNHNDHHPLQQQANKKKK